MKLFENGVGRPSNEIKKKRRVFVLCIFAIISILIITSCYLLFNEDTASLKGNVKNEYYSELYSQEAIAVELGSNVSVKKSGKYKNISLTLSGFGKDVYRTKIALCTSLNICKASNAYTTTIKNGGSRLLIKTSSSKVTKTLKIKDSSSTAKKYYLRISTYNSEGKALRSAIYELSNKKKKNSTTWNYDWSVKYGKNHVEVGSTLEAKEIGGLVSSNEIKCPSTVRQGDEFFCVASINKSHNIDFSTSSKGIAKAYPKVVEGEAYVRFKFTTTGNKKIKACKNGKCLSTTVKIVKPSSKPSLELYCSTSYSEPERQMIPQVVSHKFLAFCETLIADTKITYSADKSANVYDYSSEYSDSFTNTSQLKFDISSTYGGLIKFTAAKEGYTKASSTKNLKYVLVPNVFAMDVNTATDVILASNLKVVSGLNCENEKTTNKSKAGLISVTSIAPGTKVEAGTKIGICQYIYED